MAESKPEDDEVVDGRRARRDRNRTAVLDVVLEMFAEEALMPSIEEASKRSGLSLRSVYRYFADPDELLEATIGRSLEQSLPLAHIHAIGHGSFEHRLDVFVTTRVKIYEHSGPTYRATIHTAWRHARLRQSLADTRQRLRQQVELQFAPELERFTTDEREPVLAAADVLTQLDAVDYLRQARQFSVARTNKAIRTGLTSLLDPG